MRGALLIAVAALLCSCASAPSAPVNATETTSYALSGQIESLLAEHRLSAAEAITLNDELEWARNDFASGQPAKARRLMDDVRTKIQAATEASK